MWIPEKNRGKFRWKTPQRMPTTRSIPHTTMRMTKKTNCFSPMENWIAYFQWAHKNTAFSMYLLLSYTFCAAVWCRYNVKAQYVAKNRRHPFHSIEFCDLCFMTHSDIQYYYDININLCNGNGFCDIILHAISVQMYTNWYRCNRMCFGYIIHFNVPEPKMCVYSFVCVCVCVHKSMRNKSDSTSPTNNKP